LYFLREYFFVNGLLHKKLCGKSVEFVEQMDFPREKSVDLESIEQTEFPEKGAV
jgi:hypothetical protein